MAALTKQDLATIGSLLENDKPVRNHFSGYGRLHIDRQLPFLTVYRKPKDTADKGTHRLLLGEASYLILKNLDDWHMQLNQLVGLIQKTQNTVFGGFLLLEIWARPDSELENEHPEFRIFAPKQNCPGILLERFESALLRISVNELEASVTTEYTDAVRPPSLEAIINTRIEPGSNFIHLGLEVKPIYRDSSNTLFPFELKELRHELNRALKRLYYEFTHIGTSHRPGHYHELGRRAITKSAHNSDKQLADISNKFDLILHVTPVNTPEAWARFKDSQFQRIPEFLYRARPVDPDISVGATWEASSGKNDPLWPMVDEASPIDTDYLDSGRTGGTSELTLSAVTDPNSSLNHILRFRIQKTGNDPATGELQLWQGGSQIGTTGTQGAVNGSWTTLTYTLSGAEADAITDYSVLSFRIISAGVSNQTGLLVSWMELADIIGQPVLRTDITSEWSPKMESDCAASERAETWNTAGSISPAILYMLGIISRSPWEAVKVVVSAPALSEP